MHNNSTGPEMWLGVLSFPLVSCIMSKQWGFWQNCACCACSELGFADGQLQGCHGQGKKSGKWYFPVPGKKSVLVSGTFRKKNSSRICKWFMVRNITFKIVAVWYVFINSAKHKYLYSIFELWVDEHGYYGLSKRSGKRVKSQGISKWRLSGNPELACLWRSFHLAPPTWLPQLLIKLSWRAFTIFAVCKDNDSFVWTNRLQLIYRSNPNRSARIMSIFQET